MTEDASEPTPRSWRRDGFWEVWRWVLAVAVVGMLAWVIWLANRREDAPTAHALRVSSILNRSRQHYQAGRFKECVDTARHAAKLKPDSKEAFNIIGICAGRMKLWNEAIRSTREALRLDPSYHAARDNLAWLKRQRSKSRATKVK